jgi:hypothetical protein
MERDPITVLFQLGVVALIAIGAVLLLWRLGERRSMRGGVVYGYPPSMFPNQELARSKPLAALAAIQARLLAVYEQAPAQSDVSVWLRPFLTELRAIMDTAYRVAAISASYGSHPQLDRLVADVQVIEAQVAEHAIKLMLASDGDVQREPLDGRLATLQMCARELEAAANPAAGVLAR